MNETKVSQGKLTIFDNPAVLADEVAAWLLRLALESPDPFSIALSGGSTPKALFERLAKAPFHDQFPWAKTQLFWGDERFVPDGNKDNNYTMAANALLAHIPIPRTNIHRMITETVSAAQTAADYEATLKRFYGADTLDPRRPLFDVNLLGLGPDGHTASLIPGQPVLEERTKWVADVPHGRDEARITLTYPVLESSRYVVFLVTGEGKKDMMAHVRSGATDIPAGRLVTPGEVHWFADRSAAGV